MTNLPVWCSTLALGWLLGACSQPATPAADPQSAVSPEPTPRPSASVGPSGAVGSGGGNGVVAPEKMCGGIAAIKCPDAQYCGYAPEARCGAGDMSGTCAPKPEMCTQQFDEVCGCDNKTYPNACTAAQAGISVAMKGACTLAPSPGPIAEGKLCGTRGVPGACAEGLYCAYKADCGATDAGGVCTKKAQMCTKIYQPVCGCDGKTYGNACTAAAAGLSVAAKGECAK